MFNIPPIAVLAFVMASSFVLLVSTLATGRKSRLDARLRGLTGDEALDMDQVAVTRIARTALPKLGRVLVPSDERERSRLAARLINAGLYGRQAMPLFLGVKLVMIVGPAVAGLIVGTLGLVDKQLGLLGGASLGIIGIIGPSFWLDSLKKSRQTAFRRALPDALDVLVICLEGGLSLPGALRRVTDELGTVHPAMAMELAIVEREVQLGRTSGEALRQLGVRADLEEIRSLAAVIIQADKFGASLTKSLRIHAESLRTKRQQRAEELAQKAATKLLIPTILFIFPSVFVVILGPAALHLLRMFKTAGL